MSVWSVNISGAGPNQSGDASVDIDVLLVDFIKQLQEKGHEISEAIIKDVAYTDKGSDALAKANEG